MAGYNKYRWWTQGRPNKPLNVDAPLLLKIRNGDFDYSYMFSEARLVRESAEEAYLQTYTKVHWRTCICGIKSKLSKVQPLRNSI